MGRLEKKVAVVTGGARGIGKAIAMTMARGADIVISDWKRDGEYRSGDQGLRPKGDDRQDRCKCQADAQNLINSAVKSFGRVDILVNDAGISPWTSA
jgi:NAD(P)-dependent dehydrogenase (short-subunit alcohol dehydrogenase family)